MSKKMTEKEFEELLSLGVESKKIDLPPLVYLPLQRNGINTIYDLITFTNWNRARCGDARYTDDELRRIDPNVMYKNGIHNFGVACYNRMQAKLLTLGLNTCPIDKEPTEWVEELKEKLVHNTNENKKATKTNLIRKLTLIWNDDIEKEVQDIIDRNI